MAVCADVSCVTNDKETIMVTDDPDTRQLVLSANQCCILESLVRRTHCPQAIALRARVVLAAAQGAGMTQIGRELGCSRELARRWRDRFADAQACWGESAAQWADEVLADKIVELLEDRERSGTPATFTPEQLCQIVALACEKRPEECGRPVSHWTARELAEESIARQIVPTISPRHVGRFLKKRTFDRTRCVTG
jgi:putative transposase